MPNFTYAKARMMAENQLMRADGSINRANATISFESDLTVTLNNQDAVERFQDG